MATLRTSSFALFTALLCATSTAQYKLQASPGASILHLPETGTNITISYDPLSPTDFETFRTLQFRAPGHTYTLISREPLKYLLKIDAPGIHPGDPVRGLEMDRVRFFFTGKYTVASQPHTLLFFIGDIGINAAPLLVIGFHKDGSPYKVLDLSHYNLFSFDHPDNQPASIIGRENLSHIIGGDGSSVSRTPYATTYDPYAIYAVTQDTPATYSLAKSKLYNQQHYVWAGPKSRENYAVIYNVPGHPKPFGVPARSVKQALAGKTPTRPQ